MSYAIGEKYTDDDPNRYVQKGSWGWKQEPDKLLMNIKSTMRKSSGAAPPTAMDGEGGVTIVLRDDSGGEEIVPDVVLTYQKYVSQGNGVEKRFERAASMGDFCTNLPNIISAQGEVIYDGPFYDNYVYGRAGEINRQNITMPSAKCLRMNANGSVEPRIESNSKASMSAELNPKKYTLAQVREEQKTVLTQSSRTDPPLSFRSPKQCRPLTELLRRSGTSTTSHPSRAARCKFTASLTKTAPNCVPK